MGKASSNKKVARAAGTGGGRTARGARPWGWYGAMSAVVVVGSLTIFTSRNDRQAASNPLKSEKPRPPAQNKGFPGDHWHAAYGIYVCGQFVPAIQSDRDPSGIHTHGDGIIHIHPFTRAVSGRNATLGVFADTVGLEVGKDFVEVPGGTRYENGDTCEGQDGKGELRVLLNGTERTGDPKKLRLRDRDALVIAFAPGDAEIPEDPPSKSGLDNLSDVSPVSNPDASTTVPAGTETTVPAGTETTTETSAPAGTDSTTASSAPAGTDTTTASTAASTSSSSP